MLPNNKILAVGTSAYRKANNTYVTDIGIAKYNADGSLDTSFGAAGKVVYNTGERQNLVFAAALQADGKILVTNSYILANTNMYELLRYNADGSLDTQFGTGGRVTIAFMATAMACQPDGKIVIAGDNTTGIIISSYNNNGTPDTGFSGDGSVVVTMGNSYFSTVALALQTDGKIIVADTVIPAGDNASPQFGVVRLSSNGMLDTSFGNNGKILALVGDVSLSNAVFVQPDGKIVIAGRSVTTGVSFTSVRYNVNGELDTSYAANGVASQALGNDYRELNDVLLQADGKLLAVLSKYNQPSNTYDFRLMRFNPDGTPDADFGGAGGINTSFYNGYDEAFSVALQSDNKLIVAGSTYNGISEDFALARYTNVILGREDFESSQYRIIAYPNPVKDVIYISGNYTGQEFSIYDTTGKLLMNGEITPIGISMSALQSGMYVVKVGKESVKVVR